MAKYSRLRERVAAELVPPCVLVVPHAATDEELRRVHTAEYLHCVITGTLSRDGMRRIGLPWSPQLVERSRRSVGATLEALRAALHDGIAVILAGGTHHAYSSHGEGFGVFNDAAVAARAVQASGAAARVLVVDCDVHQGNGTAALVADDPTVFTFDIHGAKNFPFVKETCDLAVALADGASDDQYLQVLDSGLTEAIARARPEAAIYLAGADPHEGDRLGRLAVSKEGLAERDRFVIGRLVEAGIPVAVTMGGGYGEDLEDTVDIHFHTVRTAASFLGSALLPRLYHSS